MVGTYLYLCPYLHSLAPYSDVFAAALTGGGIRCEKRAHSGRSDPIRSDALRWSLQKEEDAADERGDTHCQAVSEESGEIEERRAEVDTYAKYEHDGKKEGCELAVVVRARAAGWWSVHEFEIAFEPPAPLNQSRALRGFIVGTPCRLSLGTGPFIGRRSTMTLDPAGLSLPTSAISNAALSRS